MTQHQSALSTLIGEVLADPDLAHSDVFRRMLQAGLQDLINAEATVKIGADRYEQTAERTTRRNGTRPKTLATPAGEVDLQIPKLREGSFFPSLLHPRRPVDKALYAVICQAWIDGVSTRKVDQLIRALGNDTGISRSTVSRCPASTFDPARISAADIPLSRRSALDSVEGSSIPTALAICATDMRVEMRSDTARFNLRARNIDAGE
jgi:hypothetical protein